MNRKELDAYLDLLIRQGERHLRSETNQYTRSHIRGQLSAYEAVKELISSESEAVA